MATTATEKVPKVPKIFYCICCDYTTSRFSQYERHFSTVKHIKRENSTEFNKLELKVPKICSYHKSGEYKCNKCERHYKDRTGLWKHKKICADESENSLEPTQNTIIIQQTSPDEVKNLTSMVMELMKSNNELQKQMIDVCKNSNNTIINNNNNNNKTFNLNFFLNEQCKDAMNISEFVNTFDLQLEDLESVGELGYVEGMTKIIVDKLNSMDIYKRPMHCSDAKREIIYIKDENIWAREERTNPKLRKAIKTVTFRNMKQVKKWSDKHPESLNNESHLNDKYMMLVIQSTGGNGLIGDSENKIIRRIVKEIVIGKNNII